MTCSTALSGIRSTTSSGTCSTTLVPLPACVSHGQGARRLRHDDRGCRPRPRQRRERIDRHHVRHEHAVAGAVECGRRVERPQELRARVELLCEGFERGLEGLVVIVSPGVAL